MDRFFNFLGTNWETVLSYIIKIVVIIVCLIVLIKIINIIFRRTENKFFRHVRYAGYLTVFRYTFLTIAYIAAISTAASQIPPFSRILTSILAGTGIVAIVLGIACQEPIGNLASGMIIIFSKPFNVGDLVRYIEKDISGIVEEITLRHTVIRTFENKRLIVPNGTLNENVIENSNYGDNKICLLLDFSITYDSDALLAMEIISDVVLLNPNYLDVRTEDDINNGEPPVSVLVYKFDVSAVVLRAWVWCKNPMIAINMRSDILLNVNRRFAAAGIKIAFPRTAVMMEKNN